MTDAVKSAAEKNFFIRFLDWALAPNWRDAWKWLSLYGYAIVILSPEIFQAVTELMAQFDGQQANALILPAGFVSFLRTVGTVGMIVRLIRQTKQKIDDTAATLAAAQAAADAAQAAVKEVATAVEDVKVAVEAEAAQKEEPKG